MLLSGQLRSLADSIIPFSGLHLDGYLRTDREI
jgi:hypothetical protein